MQLLADRAAELRDRYGITFRVTGVASRRMGWNVNPEGFETSHLVGMAPPALKSNSNITDVRAWLDAAKADVLFEATSLNVENGQPAIDYIRAALEHGIARQGSTLRDYRLPDGGTGTMQNEFKVYGREGEPCERCGRPIEKIRAAGRGTWFCPGCQHVANK